MSAKATLSSQSTDYPRSWDFESDGEPAEGAFIELSEAPTANGYKPIVTLDVAGERRTVWLFHEALAAKFREELERRRVPDFTPGERVSIERGAWRESESTGRTYRAYAVRFPDAPRREARAILGVGTAADEPEKPEDVAEDDIPF